MNFIGIVNKGLVYEEDLSLIGFSTSRGDDVLIGNFGSGWKYALAWFLRNNCTIRIFSGLKEIKIDYVSKIHRDIEIKVIRINGKETSITTDMGPEWTAWMAIREMVSNAIDAGEYQLYPNGDCAPEDGKTSLYIENNDAISDIINNFNEYFAFNRENGIIDEDNNIFYPKKEMSPMIIYRKGIKCFNNKGLMSLYDVNFDNINIDENRLTSLDNISLKLVIAGGVTKNINIFELLIIGSYKTLDIYSDNAYKNIKKLSEKYLFITEFLASYVSDVDKIYINTHLFMYLVMNNIIEDPLKALRGEGCPLDFLPNKNPDYDVDELNFILDKFNICVTVIFGKMEKSYDNIRITKDTVYIEESYMRVKPSELSMMILSKANKSFFNYQYDMINKVNDLQIK